MFLGGSCSVSVVDRGTWFGMAAVGGVGDNVVIVTGVGMAVVG